MDEYTWDDIIINPNIEKVKTGIGKKAYYAYTPATCLNRANHNDKDFLGKLIKIYPDHIYPFWFGASFENAYGCIILEKEKEKSKSRKAAKVAFPLFLCAVILIVFI